MRRLLPVTLLALSLAAPASGASLDLPPGRYTLDPTHTSVTFKIRHFGLSNYTARFATVGGEVMLDPAKPEASTLLVKIDANSVRTDYPFPDKEDFDKKIGSSEAFLNGAKYPDITFASKSIVVTGAKTAKVTGDLTMRGVRKPVTLDVVLNGSMNPHPMMKIPVFGISATGKLNRTEFGMAFPPVLGDEVEIIVESELGKAST